MPLRSADRSNRGKRKGMRIMHLNGGRCELVIESDSVRRSLDLGRILGALIKPGTVISLEGGLGAGKTLFAKGICSGLGVPDEVISPSFVLVEEYRGKCNVFHFDLYRLERLEEVLEIGLFDAVDGRSVVMVEWGDRLPEGSLAFDISVRLAIKGPRSRRISIGCAEEFCSELAKRLWDRC